MELLCSMLACSWGHMACLAAWDARRRDRRRGSLVDARGAVPAGAAAPARGFDAATAEGEAQCRYDEEANEVWKPRQALHAWRSCGFAKTKDATA